jgi:hypothetical protein
MICDFLESYKLLFPFKGNRAGSCLPADQNNDMKIISQ